MLVAEVEVAPGTSRVVNVPLLYMKPWVSELSVVITRHLAVVVDAGGRGGSGPRNVEGRERAVAVYETMGAGAIGVITRYLAAIVDAGGRGESGARRIEGRERAVAVHETMGAGAIRVMTRSPGRYR